MGIHQDLDVDLNAMSDDIRDEEMHIRMNGGLDDEDIENIGEDDDDNSMGF